ncbi:hypothetical protein PRIPAC_83498 [Pristionchus pacificus]|uniref:Endonuclease/exonuclease/phosphatase domain-containing protein n=1 Tax=Pristionchus pacificus TaxID=54126 RepID=A0A2A6BUU0_PRIPA|nr:hypothetical protein PRIPAC_83498 [Pristionchus pacificus]|eukprot:PDM69627.1 hypothetical protein PRIPAC_44723 [Pristionchus pacificus]
MISDWQRRKSRTNGEKKDGMQMKRERRDGYGMTRRPIDESREGRNKMDRNDCLRVGSLNVGSLNGRSYEVVDMMKRRRIDVLCVQETNWVGQESRRIDGYQIVYVGLNNLRNGVAIFIAPKYTGIIVEVIRPEVQHALYDRIIGLILDVDGKSFGIKTHLFGALSILFVFFTLD